MPIFRCLLYENIQYFVYSNPFKTKNKLFRTPFRTNTLKCKVLFKFIYRPKLISLGLLTMKYFNRCLTMEWIFFITGILYDPRRSQKQKFGATRLSAESLRSLNLGTTPSCGNAPALPLDVGIPTLHPLGINRLKC